MAARGAGGRCVGKGVSVSQPPLYPAEAIPEQELQWWPRTYYCCRRQRGGKGGKCAAMPPGPRLALLAPARSQLLSLRPAAGLGPARTRATFCNCCFFKDSCVTSYFKLTFELCISFIHPRSHPPTACLSVLPLCKRICLQFYHFGPISGTYIFS